MLPTLTRLTIGILLLALVACSAPNGTSPAGSVLSITILGGDQGVVVGSTLMLTAAVTTTGNASTTVTWTSSNASAATIDVDGRLNALATGITTITATATADPSKHDRINITVSPPSTVAWTRQFGTNMEDTARSIANDVIGNVYVAGDTLGALEGTHAGNYDAFVRSYDTVGNHRWTRQFGTSGDDAVYGLATDTNSNVYVAGYTSGSLEGANAGSADAFIRSYDSNGNHRWTRQFGTTTWDQVTSIDTDTNGNVYAAGTTLGALEGSSAGSYDAFISSYDSNGNHRWTQQFGTGGDDLVHGIAVDTNGNVFVSGYTVGALEGTHAGNYDAFVRSYDTDGNHRWTRQFGTSGNDVAYGIATDSNGNAHLAGYTTGALEGSSTGSFDAFIRSYDSNGNHRWTRQFGTSSRDVAWGIAIGANGTVVATGWTFGALDGANSGNSDAFIRSYESDGTLRWTRQFGTSANDLALGIATDASSNVYVLPPAVGLTVSPVVFGQFRGSRDPVISL